jgi:hypothetical protein
VAGAAGALDGTGPLRPGRGPGQQPFGLGNAGTDPQLTSCSSAVLIATAVCEALRGSTPIITAATGIPLSAYLRV